MDEAEPESQPAYRGLNPERRCAVCGKPNRLLTLGQCQECWAEWRDQDTRQLCADVVRAVGVGTGVAVVVPLRSGKGWVTISGWIDSNGDGSQYIYHVYRHAWMTDPGTAMERMTRVELIDLLERPSAILATASPRS